MNSKSRNYYNDDCDCGKEKDPCKKEKKKECPVIIKCGAIGSATIPAATPINTIFTPTSLTLDTSCLCNPCTKLEFTSNLTTAGYTGTVSFQVFKQCNNQFNAVPVGPAFNFASVAASNQTSIFTFFVCDCDTCNNNDCCTYTVIVTVTTTIAGTLSINNATLGAISTCQSSCSNC